MKNNKILKLAILVLGLFFALQSASSIFFKLAEDSKKSFGKNLFATAVLLFPLDQESYFRFGHSLLRDYEEGKNKNSLIKSVKYLEKSVSLNPLHYQAHQFLGRANLLMAATDASLFDEALKHFKRAALIRKADPRVTADTIKIYMSLWPLLDDKKQNFCFTLVQDSIEKMNTDDFKQIIEAWGLYSQDIQFLKSAINRNAKFYDLMVKELQKQQLELKFRQKLLAGLEQRILEKSEKKYKESLAKPKFDLAEFTRLHIDLEQKIRGYYKIVDQTTLKEKNYLQLKYKIDIKLIKHFLDAFKANKSNQDQLEKYTFSYLNDFYSVKELDFLSKLFEKESYFESSNLRNFYLHQLIHYKTGDFLSVTNEIEHFRKNVTYIKKGHTGDFVKILTLLCDGYMSSRLLTKAMDTLTEIENLSPGLDSTYWRILKIEKIIGRDGEISEEKQARFDLIRNSAKIVLSDLTKQIKVYLLDSMEFQITISEELKDKLIEYNLLSLFINGQVFYETYLKGIPDVLTIPLPVEMENSEIDVQIVCVK